MPTRPPVPTPALETVREVPAFLHLDDPDAGRCHDAGLVVTELADGSWAVELNPTEESHDGLLYLPPGSTAADALGGLLALVAGQPLPAPDPGPEITAGPTFAGIAILVLRDGTAGERRVRGEVRAAKINGTWAIVAEQAMRDRLDALTAPSAAAVAPD